MAETSAATAVNKEKNIWINLLRNQFGLIHQGASDEWEIEILGLTEECYFNMTDLK